MDRLTELYAPGFHMEDPFHSFDGDFAVMWARTYGKGRVLYDGLGHVEAVWDRPDIQKMYVEQVKWIMGLEPGDAMPRPRP